MTWPITLVAGVDPLGPVDADPDDVRDQACGVTAPGRICDPSAPDPPDDPPDLPDLWIGELLGNLLILLLIVLLALGLFWLLKRWVGSSRSDDEADATDDDLDEDVDGVLTGRIVDDDSPPARWRRLAAEHLANGDYRQAVRCRYRALVGDLARAGYVDEIPGRTSGEERGQVAETVDRLGTAVDVSRSFDRAADVFDSAWFDDREVVADDHTRFVDAETVVLAAIERGPSRTPLVGRRG